MNTADTMLPSKSLITLTILATALACGVLRQQRFREEHRAVAEARLLNQQAEQRIATASAASDAARQELAEGKRLLRDKQVAAVRAGEELTKIDPETRWASPPANGPYWDTNSPYIWISKAILPRLPGNPFSDRAELHDDVAATLGIDKATKRNLEAKLSAIMSEYRDLEARYAERIEKPLPGIQKDGPVVTVRVTPFPEQGENLKRQFSGALTDALGSQRAQLLLRAAENWMDSQLASLGAEPQTISVVRHPNGTYNLSRKTGNSWFSTGGFKDLRMYVPGHLLPLFSDVSDQGAAGQ